MKRERLIQLVATAAAVALVGAASTLLKPINSQREQMGLSATAKEVENLPPDIAFATIALGGFRGLAVDYLWMRAEMLKEQGRFYEANQLANWICKLQPRFPTVWAFQAWNLAWNISVATHTTDERWNWIYNGGVKLLRDEGIRYNPKAISLYRELAWIYFFKMGDYMDDHHWNYKRRWAWEMHRLLGAPPPDIQATRKLDLATILTEKQQDSSKQTAAATGAEAMQWREEEADDRTVDVGPLAGALKDPSVQRVIRWFQPIAEAPETWEQLVADEQMAAFVQRCEQAGIKLRVKAVRAAVVAAVTGEKEVNLNFFNDYQRVLTPTLKQQLDLRAGKITLRPDEQALEKFLKDPKTKPLAERLLAFLRAYVLRHEHKMDPKWMLALMEQLGPLDWRVPDAMGIYWASYGFKRIRELDVKDVQEFFGPDTPLNTHRQMLIALQRLTYFGRLFFEPDLEKIDHSYLDVLPDLRFVEATHQAYLRVSRYYDPEGKKIASEDLRDGHINYLRDAIRLFYMFGQRRKAAYYYAYLRKNYRLRDGKPNPEYLVPLVEFVKAPEFRERMTDMRIMTDAITGTIQRALHELAAGNGRAAAGLIRYAKKDLYDWYMSRWKENPVDRMKLPPFRKMFNDVVAGVLNMPGGEDLLAMKIRLWNQLSVATQLEVYDTVRDTLAKQCLAAGIEKMDLAFPPPPGLEKHRQMLAKRKKRAKPQYIEGEQSLLELKRSSPPGSSQSR